MQEIQGRQIGAGGRDVTAPINGAARVLPGLLDGDASARWVGRSVDPGGALVLAGAALGSLTADHAGESMTEPTSYGTPKEPYPQPPGAPHPPQPQPEKAWRSRRWIIGAAVVVVAVGITIALIVTLTGSSSTDRYGQKAADVARKLHICNNPEPGGLSEADVPLPDANHTATCNFPDGGHAVVFTFDNETAQNDLVEEAKDSASATACTVVARGFIVTAADASALTQAVGTPQTFAAKHHGYLVGNCN